MGRTHSGGRVQTIDRTAILANRVAKVEKPHHFRPRVGFVVYEIIIEQFAIPVTDEDSNCVPARAILMKRGTGGIIMA